MVTDLQDALNHSPENFLLWQAMGDAFLRRLFAVVLAGVAVKMWVG